MPNNPSRWRLALAAVAAASGLAGGAQGRGIVCDPGRVVLDTAAGPVRLTVEVADDAAERAQGLMFRKELADHQGMLFVYEQPQQVAFWMRNTLIPLDMLFIDASGTIRHIQPMARPLDETPIPGAAAGDPDSDRLMVLEIPGGGAARLGLATGDRLAHPAVPQDGAALPCR